MTEIGWMKGGAGNPYNRAFQNLSYWVGLTAQPQARTLIRTIPHFGLTNKKLALPTERKNLCDLAV
jgi:hypothetical protein